MKRPGACGPARRQAASAHGRSGSTLLRRAALLALVLVMLVCGTGASFQGEEYTDVGLDAALERSREVNEWRSEHTAAEIAEEKHLSVWDVWSPNGTETLPDPVITVQEGDSWEDVVERLLAKYDAPSDRVGLGYYNTVTGEEHYINADEYRVSASMFKVPLNMIYADRVSSGQMTMDTQIYYAPYSWYQYRTIVQSDNERSVMLFNNLGGYTAFKDLQIAYLGNDPAAELGSKYYADNYYTPREFIHLLRMLEEDPERFPGVVENMLDAEPYSYFREYDTRYPIAQKYGFVQQNEGQAYHTYINTCGIVYADAPFCLVIFTDNIGQAYDLISEYSMVMCDYTALATAAAEEAAAEAAEEQAKADSAKAAAVAEVSARVAADAAAWQFASPAGEKAVNNTGITARLGMTAASTIVLVLIAAAMIIAFTVIFRNNAAGRINGFWAVVAILLAGLGLSFCVIGVNLGTLYANPAGDPQATVEAFFSDIAAENYDDAYGLLANYSTLGLENAPDSEEGRMLYEAMHEALSYNILGDCVRDKLTATQSVAVRYLNVPNVMAAVQGRLDIVLGEVVESRTDSQLYDADGNYLDSVKDEVYRRALSEVLSEDNFLESYCSSKDLSVLLSYSGGTWRICADDNLVTALSGGTL